MKSKSPIEKRYSQLIRIYNYQKEMQDFSVSIRECVKILSIDSTSMVSYVVMDLFFYGAMLLKLSPGLKDQNRIFIQSFRATDEFCSREKELVIEEMCMRDDKALFNDYLGKTKGLVLQKPIEHLIAIKQKRLNEIEVISWQRIQQK